LGLARSARRLHRAFQFWWKNRLGCRGRERLPNIRNGEAGASVISFDADRAERFFCVPYESHQFIRNYPEWLNNNTDFLMAMRNIYWRAHHEFQSKAQTFYGDIYDLPDSLGQFDVAMIGQILVHLSDPIRARNYPGPIRIACWRRNQAMVWRMVWNDPAPARRAVSTALRTAVSYSAAHMAR
jgi:hypothetical protein